ncbi:Transmembrane protein [Orchesella cincta]|uniref:Transmembrane protein n=1 Tax=Orchesella cincta TaxID=48709 RepID=A0A1D2NFR7_ORCCI|nr:Transmembrane protein [Orchesella cincta]
MRAIEGTKAYTEGLRSVFPLVTPDFVLKENEGKLVHMVGYLRIPEPLEDAFYGVSITAVKLKRRVQMYQWVEEEISSNSEEIQLHNSSHKYSKMWRDKLIDSSKFHDTLNHENPFFIPVSSQILMNPYVYIGKFALGKEFKDKFKTFIQFTGGERPESLDIKMHMGLYYHSSDLWNPSVGDLRIQFSFAGPTGSFVSIVAKQSGSELKPFYTESGAQIAFLHEGKKSHTEIFVKEHALVTLYAWIIRLVSVLAVVFGSWLSSKTITLLNRRNQVVQNLMSVGPMRFSLIIAVFLSNSTVGLAWIPHTPLFGILMITFASCLLLYYALVGDNITNNKPMTALPQYSQMY